MSKSSKSRRKTLSHLEIESFLSEIVKTNNNCNNENENTMNIMSSDSNVDENIDKLKAKSLLSIDEFSNAKDINLTKSTVESEFHNEESNQTDCEEDMIRSYCKVSV